MIVVVSSRAPVLCIVVSVEVDVCMCPMSRFVYGVEIRLDIRLVNSHSKRR
jgi:hypothetical protein